MSSVSGDLYLVAAATITQHILAVGSPVSHITTSSRKVASSMHDRMVPIAYLGSILERRITSSSLNING